MNEANEPIRQIGKIVTRPDAKAAGLKRFFTGSPCKSGHVAERYTSSGGCITCDAHGQIGRYRREHPVIQHRSGFANEQERAAAKLLAIKEWSAANPARVKEIEKRSKKKRADQNRAVMKAWRAANPERVSAYNRNWRAGANGGKHTAAEVRSLLFLQKGKCAYCRTKLGDSYQVDHIVAVSKGGTNDRKNLQITCVRCNCSKRATDPIVFARGLGLLI